MSEPKPLAALSASLLARKGEARPAIRRAYVPLTTVTLLPQDLHEDLGWNDMGAAAPVAAVPTQQQDRIAKAYGTAPETGPNARKAKAAFTLRLDSDRHLRLRLASAVGRRSAQQIVTLALDAWLDAQPGLDELLAEAHRTMPIP